MERPCRYWERYAQQTTARDASFVFQVCLVYSVCLVMDPDQKDQIDQTDQRTR